MNVGVIDSKARVAEFYFDNLKYDKMILKYNCAKCCLKEAVVF
jgi:hypothetical protein